MGILGGSTRFERPHRTAEASKSYLGRHHVGPVLVTGPTSVARGRSAVPAFDLSPQALGQLRPVPSQSGENLVGSSRFRLAWSMTSLSSRTCGASRRRGAVEVRARPRGLLEVAAPRGEWPQPLADLVRGLVPRLTLDEREAMARRCCRECPT